MIGRDYRLLALLFAVVGFSARIGGQEATDVQATVRGILARSEAVFSGRMSYRETTGFQDVQSHYTRKYDLVFMLPSWRLSTEEVKSNDPVFDAKGAKVDGLTVTGVYRRVTQSHNGKLVKFTQTPQFDRSIGNSVHISSEQPLADKSQAPPVFAGTIWYNCTKEFVKKHAAAARRKAEEIVDGYRVEVLEWNVAESEAFSAFFACAEGTIRGGMLRLYAAPDLGYALPRIEHVGRDGSVSSVLEAVGFSKYSEGIFLPKQCSRKDLEKRVQGNFITYDLDRVSAINEPIADSEFVIHLPDGTSGSDARSGKGSTPFIVKSDGILPDGVADVIQRRNPFWGFNRTTAIAVGCAVGAIALGVYYAVRRFLRQRTS